MYQYALLNKDSVVFSVSSHTYPMADCGANPRVDLTGVDLVFSDLVGKKWSNGEFIDVETEQENNS